MTAPLAYGLDFGTTNSAISVLDTDGYVTVVPVGTDGSPTVPSILYLDATGNRVVGDNAVRSQLIAGPRHGRLISSIKSWLTDERFTTTTGPDGRELTMADLVAGILSHLKRDADRFSGGRCDRVVLGRPVIFAGALGSRFEAQMALATERLVEAATIAGFAEVHLLDESTAALQGEPEVDGVLVATDFGGGTFDVSLIDPTSREVLATHGVAVGGEYFDGLVFDDAVAPVLGLDREHVIWGKKRPVPDSIGQMRTLGGTLSAMTDDRAYEALQRWRSVLPEANAILLGGHGYAFFRAVEGMKIDLSELETAHMEFSRPNLRVSTKIERRQFEDAVEHSMRLIARTIDEALAAAGVSELDVAGVVRTGGSSRIPAFVRLLEQRFGAEKVLERDAFTTVAEGLGFYGWQVWG